MKRERYGKRAWNIHAAERLDILEPCCAERRCSKVAGITFSTPFGDRSFCLVHAPRRGVHYEILERIRNL